MTDNGHGMHRLQFHTDGQTDVLTDVLMDGMQFQTDSQMDVLTDGLMDGLHEC